MSNYGIDASNASGELTFSDNGKTYGYIGRASLQAVNQPGTNTVNSLSGNSVYTINWWGDIIVALPIKSDGATYVSGMSQSNGVWTIYVYKGGSTVNSLGFETQVATEVFVFGSPVSSSGYGVSIYDNSGNLVGDLSLRPLTYSAFVTMDLNTLSAQIPGLSVPAVIGMTSSRSTQSVRSGSKWINRITGFGWKYDPNSTSILRTFVQNSYSQDDGAIAVTTTRFPATCIIIEAAGL